MSLEYAYDATVASRIIQTTNRDRSNAHDEIGRVQL